MKSSKSKTRWILTYCPNTGDEVVGTGWDKLLVTSGGQATWWQCPSCGGWHLAIAGDLSGQQRKYVKQEAVSLTVRHLEPQTERRRS